MKHKIINVLSKTKVTLSILVIIILLFLTIYRIKGGYDEGYVIDKFGIIFDKIDFSILYRFFTMMLFVNGKEVFGGILVLIVFMGRYEYLQGSKRTLILIFLGNLTAFISQYIFLYQIKGYKDYTDLALSNAGWAILGGLVILFGRKWGAILLFILLAYNFISLAIPEYSSFQVAHVSALIIGMIMQKFAFVVKSEK